MDVGRSVWGEKLRSPALNYKSMLKIIDKYCKKTIAKNGCKIIAQ